MNIASRCSHAYILATRQECVVVGWVYIYIAPLGHAADDCVEHTPCMTSTLSQLFMYEVQIALTPFVLCLLIGGGMGRVAQHLIVA